MADRHRRGPNVDEALGHESDLYDVDNDGLRRQVQQLTQRLARYESLNNEDLFLESSSDDEEESIMDWSKPPIYDDESIEEIHVQFQHKEYNEVSFIRNLIAITYEPHDLSAIDKFLIKTKTKL